MVRLENLESPAGPSGTKGLYQEKE